VYVLEHDTKYLKDFKTPWFTLCYHLINLLLHCDEEVDLDLVLLSLREYVQCPNYFLGK
jgi:hypothetical protein